MSLEVVPPREPAAGTVHLDGGKHGFAHVLACAALADRGHLTNVPDHIDSRALRSALRLIFDLVEYDRDQRRLRFSEPRSSHRVVLPAELTAASRSLFCLYPALLTRADEVVSAAAPQGCAIGNRPAQWYLRILRSFGVLIDDGANGLSLSWPRRRCADIKLDYPTMTGTVIAVAAAAACAGDSRIMGVSAEPSCADQADCLRRMGAEVGSDGEEFTVASPGAFETADSEIPHDRIHAITYLTAGLLTGGGATVVGNGPMRIPRFVEFLRSAGCAVDETADRITASAPDGAPLAPVDVDAGSEPKFSSDWGPFALLLMALGSSGRSRIADDVFPGRFQFMDHLAAHGLTNVVTRAATLNGRDGVVVEISGRPDLTLSAGRYQTCPDIRGSAALVLAALRAQSRTVVAGDFHIRRGYTDMAADLRKLGIEVRTAA